MHLEHYFAFAKPFVFIANGRAHFAFCGMMVFILMDAFFNQKRLEARNTLGAETLATLKKIRKKQKKK